MAVLCDCCLWISIVWRFSGVPIVPPQVYHEQDGWGLVWVVVWFSKGWHLFAIRLPPVGHLAVLLQNLTKVSHLSHIASAHKCYILCASVSP